MTAKKTAAKKTAAKKPPADDPEAIAAAAQPSDPTRCGGYVLTEQGWQLATDDDLAAAEGEGE